jgi:hypothetical protein
MSANRLREILSALASARFPRPSKRRYDLVGEAMQQAVGGEGGGRGPVRAGGVEDAPAEDALPDRDPDDDVRGPGRLS